MPLEKPSYRESAMMLPQISNRPRSFKKIDRLLRRGHQFLGNLWNGRLYEITFRARGIARTIVLRAKRPYDKIVDASGDTHTLA